MNISDETDYENKNMAVCFSMTLYSILSIDKALRTVKINFVMDFKYNINDYVRNLGYTLPPDPCAQDFQIPWTIPNTISIERGIETHYFKQNCYGCSVYKQGDRIINGLITGSNVIKCESYTMITESTYYTQEMHAPFDTIFIIVKIITTGQPGTEYMSILEDTDDSNFQGYRTIGGSYKPLWNDIKDNVIVKKVSVKYDEITDVTYPRIYVILPFKHEWRSDVVKYYAIPCVMYMLLIFIKITEKNDLIGISSSLVLANIALLFTMEKASVITFKEQIVIVQIFYILGSTLILLSLTLNTLITRIVLGSCNFMTTCICFGTHYYISRCASKAIRSELDNNDFSSLHTM